MHKVGQISLLHAALLVMTFIGLKNHVTILTPTLEQAKRDGWLSVIIGSIAIFPLLLLIIYIQNKSNRQPMKVWLKEKIGTFGSSIILYTVACYLFFLAAFTMHETILWMTNTFLNDTPTIILLFIYIIVCFLLVSTNIQTIVIMNAFVLLFVIVFGFFVAFVNIQVKDYALLQPFLEHGFSPVILGAIYPASGFIELFLLLFLQHHLKKSMKWYHIAIMLLLLVGLTLGPLVGAIIEFGPEEAAKQRYPAFEEWGLASIGRFVEHMDFLSIYQWLSGTVIRVGLLLFIAADILNFTGKRKQIWIYMVPPFTIINLILYLFEDISFLKVNNHEFLIITFFFFFTLTIIISLIALFTKNNKNKNVRRTRSLN